MNKDMPWFRCKGCDKAIIPHKIRILSDDGIIQVWEDLCPTCRAGVPHWNPHTEQWNNDDSSVRFNQSSMGDALGELLNNVHNGGTSGGSFNSEYRD